MTRLKHDECAFHQVLIDRPNDLSIRPLYKRVLFPGPYSTHFNKSFHQHQLITHLSSLHASIQSCSSISSPSPFRLFLLRLWQRAHLELVRRHRRYVANLVNIAWAASPAATESARSMMDMYASSSSRH